MKKTKQKSTLHKKKIVTFFFLPFLLTSCSFESLAEFVGLGNSKKISHYNNDNLKQINPDDITCKTTQTSTNEEAYTLNSFFCDFEAFDIEVLELPEMSNKKLLVDVYKWMVNSIFYGSEIYTLEKVVFNGNKKNGDLFGSYSPYWKTITLFPNNSRATNRRRIPTWVAEKFGKTEITPYDLEYWKYTLSHEYGHHQNFIYGSTNQIIELKMFGSSSEKSDLYDFELNAVGKQFLDKYMDFENMKENSSVFSAEAITALSSSTTKCSPSQNNNKKDSKPIQTKNWPERTITKNFNEYMWTSAERLTRIFQVLTHQVPKELQQDDSVLAFGEIINDYSWLGYYKKNIYENYFDDQCKKLQDKLNKKLEEFKVLMQEKWFAEKDNDISASAYSGQNILHFFSPIKNAKIELKNGNKTITFSEKQRFTNTFYNWRPFDSRKSKNFKIESIPYVADKKVKPGQYEVYFNGARVKKAMNLKPGDTKLLISDSKYFDEFRMTDDGLILDSSKK